MMGECGCGPDEEGLFRIGDKLVYWSANWHTCPGCDAGPGIQFILDPYTIQAALENGLKEVMVDEKNVGVIAGPYEEDKVLLAALSHMREQHVHDKEECSDWFTTKGKLRKQPDLYNDWPPGA